MLKVGSTEISSVFLGDQAISAVYCGSTLIWPEETPPTPPTPASTIVMTGAGNSQMNTTYTKQDWQYNDHDVYVDQTEIYYIFFNESIWVACEGMDEWNIDGEFHYRTRQSAWCMELSRQSRNASKSDCEQCIRKLQ